MDDTSDDESLYRELTVNDAAKIEPTLSQMEQWSILSNVINYVFCWHPSALEDNGANAMDKSVVELQHLLWLYSPILE